MKWEIHSAIITGHDHEQQKRNRQDFCGFFSGGETNPYWCGGVICDGCSEGEYSETGAALTGNLILNIIKKEYPSGPIILKQIIEKRFDSFIDQIVAAFRLTSLESISFIHQFMLSTFIFSVIDDERIVIGNSGDGVIVIDDDIRIIDQQGAPHYIAYRKIPADFLADPRHAEDRHVEDRLAGISINEYSSASVKRVVIASDGLIPLVESGRIEELFRTEKRQLQRKFNVWQQKEKLFHDDVSCVVFERREHDK